MRCICENRRSRGFTVKDLAVTLTCLLIAAGVLTSLAGANRDLSQASVCMSNLDTLFGGLMAYVDTYNSFPPNNPYPRWTNEIGSKNGLSTGGIDPNIGWILTYGLAMEPPATYPNGHFQWFVLNENELPPVCVCPGADYARLFTLNPEIDANNIESFVMQYAAFYQTSGTCRSATTMRTVRVGSSSEGGRNPQIPDPTYSFTAHLCDNAQGGIPIVWLYAKSGDPTDPAAIGYERGCWVQAVHPAEVQEPSRVYYMADSREYRPEAGGWPGAAISDGWLSGFGNKVFLSTRHYEYANVMYLDGQVNRDNQAHPIPQWNMDYDATTGQARSSHWRCATFADPIAIARIETQHHIMPVLMATGWEAFFNADGVAAK